MKYFYNTGLYCIVGIVDVPLWLSFDDQTNPNLQILFNSVSLSNLLKIINGLLELDQETEISLDNGLLMTYFEKVCEQLLKMEREVSLRTTSNNTELRDSIKHFSNGRSSSQLFTQFVPLTPRLILISIMDVITELRQSYILKYSSNIILEMDPNDTEIPTALILKYGSRFETELNGYLSKIADFNIMKDNVGVAKLEEYTLVLSEPVFDYEHLQDVLSDEGLMALSMGDHTLLDEMSPIPAKLVNVSLDLQFVGSCKILAEDQRSIYMEYFTKTSVYNCLPSDIQDMYNDPSILLGLPQTDVMAGILRSMTTYSDKSALNLTFTEYIKTTLNDVSLYPNESILSDFTLVNKIRSLEYLNFIDTVYRMHVAIKEIGLALLLQSLIAQHIIVFPVLRHETNEQVWLTKVDDEYTVNHINIKRIS